MNGLRQVAAYGHDRSGGFHAGIQSGWFTGEAFELPAGKADRHRVGIHDGFHGPAGFLQDGIQSGAQTQLGVDGCQVDTEGLGTKCAHAAEVGIDRQDRQPIARRRQGEFDAYRPGDLDVSSQLAGRRFNLPAGCFIDRHRRYGDHRITAVNAHAIHVFSHTDQLNVIVCIANQFHLDFAMAGKGRFDVHRVYRIGRQSSGGC